MIPSNAKPQRVLNILLLGEIHNFIPGMYRPYLAFYYKYFKELGHRVLSVCSLGDIRINGPCTYQQHILPYLKGFQPDLIIFGESYPFSQYFQYQSLRQSVRVPTVFISIDTLFRHREHARIGNYFDFVFISDRDFLGYFRQNCRSKTFCLPYACDPDVHRSQFANEITDLAFIGTAWSRPIYYQDRIQYLNEFQKLFHCDFHETTTEAEAVQIYSKAKIIFNFGPFNGVNARIFEAMSYGKLLLTNRTNSLKGYFEDLIHLVFYRDLPDAIRLTRFFLNHPLERRQIAARGQSQVWKKHTFYHRVVYLLLKVFGTTIYANNRGR
jgi:hypothetical protein